MKKLQLKHLAPYLPYGLKCVTHLPKDKNNSNRPLKITELLINKGCVRGILLDKQNKDVKYQYKFIKPILRPLSDLTKEIYNISDGKELEPLLDKVIPSELLKKYWFTSIRNDGHFSIDNGDGTCTGFTYRGCNYDILLLLFEWHFDVFGLIEKGLAIDKNTLKDE